MSDNLVTDFSKIYLEQIAEAKVDTGSAEEKATARNKRNTPAGKNYKFDTSVFITRKPGESLDSARTRTRRKEHAKKRGVKEGFSDWRNDLREVVDEPESKAEKEVTEKKVKNKVIINPKLTETVDNMGGTLLKVEEVSVELKPDEDSKVGGDISSKERRQNLLKKQVLLRKLQAVRQGAGQDIVASYDPIEDAVEYFYEEGINEEGVNLLIEEIGLEEFVDFVDGGAVYLNEERAARKASVRAKSYEKVKAEVDASDAAKRKAKKGEYAPSYAKKETDVTVYDDDKPAAKKKAPVKKPVVKKEAPKPAPKKVTKPVAKKVVKAVAKVKKSQPKKEVSKKGIRGAIERGVARHKAAVGKAKAEVGKVVKTAKATAKQHSQHRKDFTKSFSPTAKEKKIVKGVGKAVKKALTREELELLEKLDKVEEEVGISSAEKMEYARREAELRKREDEAVKKKKGDKQKAAARKKSVNARKHLTPSELKKYDTDGDGKVRVVNASFSNWRNELIEKDLNAAERRALPDKDFALPGKGKGPEGKQAGSYPIPDENHARMALAMVAKHGTPEKKEKVRAAVAKKFPGIQQEGYKKLPVAKMASKISKKQFKAGQSGDVKTISKKSTETGKMIGVLDTHDPQRSKAKSKIKEDKAFDTVVANLRKQHGKDSVITKDNPPKPPTEAEKKAYAAHKAKIAAQDTRDDLEKSSQGRYSRKYSNVAAD